MERRFPREHEAAAITQITAERYRHAVRTSHAKSHGLLKGELRVLDQLPEPLRQGLFAEPRTYPVLVRMANVPGEILKDGVTTERGLSIKVLDVGADPDALRTATVGYFQDNAAEFELRIQLCTDLDTMPVEDASKE